uniref:Uncharacterized protein n=1 Tax=Oryza glumipatula TaxID=40148 RepID=A0A0D9YEE2_9ORYZ
MALEPARRQKESPFQPNRRPARAQDALSLVLVRVRRRSLRQTQLRLAPKVRVRRRFTSPLSAAAAKPAGRRAAATGEALGRPALQPRPGVHGGSRPPGLTARWQGISTNTSRAWEKVRCSPQTQPPVTPTLDEAGRRCHLSPATKWAADLCGFWMRARTPKSIVESRLPKLGRVAWQEQRGLLHTPGSGCAATHLHHRAVRPGGRPPARDPGRGGRAGRPGTSPVVAARLPADSRRRPDEGEVKRRRTRT